MSPGSMLRLVRNGFRAIRERYHLTEREYWLMKTSEHLAAAVDRLLAREADLQAQLAQAQANPPAPSGGLTEEDANSLIGRIEAVTGPVPDPSIGAVPISIDPNATGP